MQSGSDQSPDLEPVVSNRTEFSLTWLQGKSVAPVPVGQHIDAALTRRIASGCRAVGATHILWESLAAAANIATCNALKKIPIDSGHEEIIPPSVICIPGGEGAVLYREASYALIAGNGRFMTTAVGEGVDMARARFARYAHAVSSRHPTLTAVARAYPPTHTAWSPPADIAPDSGAARQLALLDQFADGVWSSPDFAHDWWDARRTSQANGERLKAPLADLFDRVFMILEDYAADPDFREPGDLTDEELYAAIRELSDAFRGSAAD
jgi:hypothetical protein